MTTYSVILFIRIFTIGKSTETEGSWLSREGYMEGLWIISNGHGVPFWSNENILKLTTVMDIQLCEYTKSFWNFAH